MTTAIPQSGPIGLVLSRLGSNGVKPNGSGSSWTARCPAHDDRQSSLSVTIGDDGRALVKCFAGCDAESIVAAMGLQMKDLFTPREERRMPAAAKPTAPTTMKILSAAKGITQDFLREQGVKDTPDGVLIEYRLMDGSPAPRQRLRTALAAKDGSRWLPGEGSPAPYGLDRLPDAREQGYLVLVEGESDCWILWMRGFPALGIPGAAMAGKIEPEYLAGIQEIYFWREPDRGGDTFAEKIPARLREIGYTGVVKEMKVDGVKDPADLYLRGGFDDVFNKALDEAKIVEPSDEPVAEAKADGSPEGDPDTEQYPALILDPAAPLDCARAYIDRKHTRDGVPTLLHHRGEFFAWTGKDYRKASEGEIRCNLWYFLDGALRRQKVGKGEEESIVPFKPNKVRVGDIFDGLRAAANVAETVEPPAFIDTPGKEGRNFLALRNELLNVFSRKTEAHTPRFFNRGSVGYDFDPEADCPAWEKVKDDWFDDDMESRDALEEMLGLLLIPETKYQKLFLLVGPKRSGKGTIGRLIPKLLGANNVVTPTMATLGDRFGLQEAIGKTVAVVGDARLKSDAEEVAERLLAISGVDSISIPRKYLPDWNGSLGLRFVLLSNETPQINDPSGALASRFVVIQFTESFIGREDLELDQKLEAELPGILNRCLAGLDRLTRRGRFLQPEKGAGAVADIEDLGSPMKMFIKEILEFQSSYMVQIETAYEAWKKWCERNGRDYPGTLQRFSRDMRTALGGDLKIVRPWGEGERPRFYVGFRVKGQNYGGEI